MMRSMNPTSTITSYEDAVAQHRWEVPEHYNIAADVCDRHPREKLAMIHEDFAGNERTVNWGELQDNSNRFANVLVSLGVGPGDRVAMVLPPTPETAAAFFGTWKTGAILLSMSVLYGDEGIKHRLTDSQAKVLVTNAANADRIEPSMVEQIVILDDELLARGSTAFECVDTLAEDPAQLYNSSGTTGLAKGILHAHRYILAHEEFSYCHDVRDGEVFHGMGEWAWAAGICPLIGPWRLGAVQAVYQREGGFDPHKQLDFLSRRGVTNVFGTPTAIRSMMSITDAGTRYPQKFRIVCSAGEPLNPEAIRWFREQYGITVLDYYGLTESYPLCANYPFMEVREGPMGQANARVGRRDPRRGRAPGRGGRAGRDLHARTLESSLSARILEPAGRRYRGGFRWRVVPHQGCGACRSGRVLLVRGPRRRRDHLGRLSDPPVRG
jgi:acetyl-CoA synthetase